MKTSSISLLAALAVLSTSFTGCETAAGTGAIAGGIIGGVIGNDVRGVAIGAGIGALVGAAADESHYRAQRSSRYRIRVASRTDRYGYVVSPYHPYRTLNVRGYRSGDRVVDPASDRIFIVP